MILAMSCISLLGSIVWAHHMFTVGLISDTRAYFMSVTMIISIPTGSKIFNWLSTYIGSNTIFNMITTSVVFFGVIFLIMFTIGGSTGVILGSTIVDIGLHDTYYVVTHFHLVLSLGTVIAILLGCHFIQDYLLSKPSYLGSNNSLIITTQPNKITICRTIIRNGMEWNDEPNTVGHDVAVDVAIDSISDRPEIRIRPDNRLVNRSVATYESNIIQSNIITELSLHSITSSITRYYLIVNFVGTTSTFIPMHFLGFNVMPRRIPDFPDY
jgi:hypothetical protein